MSKRQSLYKPLQGLPLPQSHSFTDPTSCHSRNSPLCSAWSSHCGHDAVAEVVTLLSRYYVLTLPSVCCALPPKYWHDSLIFFGTFLKCHFLSEAVLVHSILNYKSPQTHPCFIVLYNTYQHLAYYAFYSFTYLFLHLLTHVSSMNTRIFNSLVPCCIPHT